MHPSTGYGAIAPELMKGPSHIPQGYGIDQFLREGILILAAQPDYNVAGVILPFSGQRLMEAADQIEHLASFGLLVSDTKANGRVWRDVGGFPAVTYNLDAKDVRLMHEAMIRTKSEVALAAGAEAPLPVSVVGHGPVDGAKGLTTPSARSASARPTSSGPRTTRSARAAWARTRRRACSTSTTPCTTSPASSSSTGARCAARSA